MMRFVRNANFRQFLRYLSVLFSGTVIASGFSFVAQLLLTRSLTVAEFGQLAALLAVINVATPIASAGVNWFLLQAFGREGWGAIRWVRPSMTLAAAATALSGVLVLGYALYRGGGNTAESGLILLSAIAILLGQVTAELASAPLQLEGRYEALATWQAAMQTGRLVAVIGVAFVVPLAPFSGVLIGYAIVGTIITAIGVQLMRGLWTGKIRLVGHDAPALSAPSTCTAPSLRNAAAEAMPFALMTIFYLVYFQGSVITLEWLRDGGAAAIYNAAFLIIAAIFLIPNVIYMRLLTAPLCRWAEHDRKTFEAALHVGVPAMALLGTGIAAVAIISAGWVVPLLFGAKYVEAAVILQILAIGIPLRFVQSAYSSIFVSKDNMVRKVKYLGISATIGLAASLCLIPLFGVAGAAAVTVLAEAILLVLHVCGTSAVITGFSFLDTIRIGTVHSALRHLAGENRVRA